MADVMLTITFGEDVPSIESAAVILGVPVSAFNQQFGIILIDPIASKYTVLIDESYSNKVRGDAHIEGPFSSPGIAHCGPVG